MPARRILLSSTLNTRDLGGYPAAEERTTQFARIIRSDAPYSLTAEDIRILKRCGVAAAIDFRSDEEAAQKPSAFEHEADFKYFRCPFAIGNRDPGSKEEVPPLYAEIIADYPVMQQIFKIIAEEKGAVLIHCAAGKDRTGIVSALLLLTAGVAVSDILVDYQISYTYRRHLIRKFLREHPELPPYLGLTDMEYMEQTLDQFFKTYGGIQNYLQRIGLTEEDMRQVKTKLLL